MPKRLPLYRVVSEAAPRAGRLPNDARSQRGDESPSLQREVSTVPAVGLAAAVAAVESAYAVLGKSRRIVSAEEILDGALHTMPRAELLAAITSQEPDLVDEAGSLQLYLDDDFCSYVERICTALSCAGVLHGLSVSVVRDSDGCPDSAMVEVRDAATNTYRAVSAMEKNLIDDRSATGADAIVSIARALLRFAEDLR